MLNFNWIEQRENKILMGPPGVGKTHLAISCGYAAVFKHYKVIFYTNHRGDCPVDEFLDNLETKVRAKVLKWLQLLSEQGPRLPRPYADVLEGPIRELRVSLARLEVRLLYFFDQGRIIVVSHGFLKKTRTVPKTEIERAKTVRANWLKAKRRRG